MPKKPLDPRKRLQQMLAGEIDVTTLYELADELASGNGSARFTVDAGHISRLGFELVTKKETAVGELIKNAYDADASTVHLVFSGDFESLREESRRSAVLEIIDTGDGMSYEELINGFMRLSTPIKIDNPRSKNSRDRAGSKGIGRFATQRLGRRLDVFTQTSGAGSGWHLSIDWDQFQPHSSIYAIPVNLKEVKGNCIGTTLAISGLRDAWTDDAVRSLRDFVGPLVEPSSPEGKPRKGKESFNVFIERPQHAQINVQEDVYTTLIRASLARIAGSVTPKGLGKVEIKSDLLKLDDSFEFLDAGDRPFEELTHARFIVYYYNISRDAPYAPPRSTVSAVREQLQTHGGVRMYRNGFRVVPYGDRGNDWLGLDAQYRKRARPTLFPFGNANFFGYVTIQDRTHTRFEETASREGLLENAAFASLRRFVFHALLTAVGKIDAKKRLVATPKPTTEREIRESLSRVQRNAKALKVARSASQRQDLIGEIERDTRSVQRQLKKYYTQHIEETGMLRVLASLGITLSGFIHELGQTMTFIYTDLKTISSKLPAATRMRLDANASILEDFTRYFDAVLRDNASRELREIELHDVMNQFESFAQAVCNERGVQLSTQVEGYEVFTRPMHMSEWSAILLNLLSNSLKAIRRAGKPGRIAVVAREDGNNIVVDFLDDGDGIPKEDRDKVFVPFFTTSNASDEELSGMGLGLKIVSDLVTANRGTVAIIDPGQGFSTCFRISIPARKDEAV
jgi:signal transduction histidine kinase